MRFFAFLMIIGGLLAAFGYPFYHGSFTNFEIGEYTIFEKGEGYQDQSILLTPDDAPINIAFEAIASTNEVKGGADTAFQIEIRNGLDIVRTETVRFSGPMGDTSAETTSSIQMNVDLNALPITEPAVYTFAFAQGDVNDIPLASIKMRVTGIVTAMNGSIVPTGYTLMGVGTVLFLFSGTKRRKRRGNAPAGTASKASRIGRRPKAEPPAPKKETRKWGRGDSDT